MGGVRVTVISDTHLSGRAPGSLENWEAVAAHVERERPEAVVHAGDLTFDAASDPGELVAGRRMLDGLGVPWVAVPGNHDVGDNPGTSGPAVAPEWLERWVSELGPDRWSLDLGRWTLLGVDAQLFGSGLAAEEDQWSWLDREVAALPGGRPVALVIHKPLWAGPNELEASGPSRFAPPAARRRLDDVLHGRHVPLVVSGHVHQYRVLLDDRRLHAWAPTAWAVLPEEEQQTIGLKRCGVLSIVLDDDGTAGVDLVEPDGLVQYVVGRDIDDPYDHLSTGLGIRR